MRTWMPFTPEISVYSSKHQENWNPYHFLPVLSLLPQVRCHDGPWPWRQSAWHRWCTTLPVHWSKVYPVHFAYLSYSQVKIMSYPHMKSSFSSDFRRFQLIPSLPSCWPNHVASSVATCSRARRHSRSSWWRKLRWASCSGSCPEYRKPPFVETRHGKWYELSRAGIHRSWTLSWISWGAQMCSVSKREHQMTQIIHS